MDEVNQLHLVIPSRRDSSHRHMTKRFLLGLSSGKDASRWPGPLLFTAACWQCDGIVKDLVQEVITLKKEWVFFFLKNLFISPFHFRSWPGNIGPLRESAQVKQRIPPGVYPQVDCQNTNKVENASSFDLWGEKQTKNTLRFPSSLQKNDSALPLS